MLKHISDRAHRFPVGSRSRFRKGRKMKIKNIFLTTVFATLSTVAIAADTAKPADDAHKGKSVKGETPEEVAKNKKSYTAQFLKKELV